MPVQPIPEGYHSVTPYLIVDNAKTAIDFYTRAFGAQEKFRMPMGERIVHAELTIGDSHVMLADEFPDMGYLSPKSRGGATSSLFLYVEDVDAGFRRAVEAGAIEVEAVKDQFWGDRMGTLRDPFGHVWTLATHVADVPEEEMQQRMEAWSAKQGQAQREPAE